MAKTALVAPAVCEVRKLISQRIVDAETRYRSDPEFPFTVVMNSTHIVMLNRILIASIMTVVLNCLHTSIEFVEATAPRPKPDHA